MTKTEQFGRLRASVSVKRNLPVISDSSTGISRQGGGQSGIFMQTTKNSHSKRFSLNSPTSALDDGRRLQQLKNMVKNRNQQQKRILSQNKMAPVPDSVMKKRLSRNIGRPKTQSTVQGRVNIVTSETSYEGSTNLKQME